MNIIESIKLALEGLKLNKLRTFLTMLGIIIGIGSVIGILTVGKSIEKSFLNVYDQLGSKQMSFYLDTSEGYNRDDLYADGFIPELNLDMLDESMEHFSDQISGYSVEDSNQATIDHGRDKLNINITAILPGYLITNKLQLLSGRFINEEDIKSFRNTIVVGKKLVDKVYDGDFNKALGSELILEQNDEVIGYTIVGIVKDPEMNFGALGGMVSGYEEPMSAYIPWTSNAQRNYNYNFQVQHFTASPKEGIDSISLAQDISSYIKEKYFSSSPAVEIGHHTMEQEIQDFNKGFSSVQYGIGGIAAISLLVGGIGVMNILLVSVTERTREIGIRKALGATTGDIRVQFLIEAMIVCFIGGLIGIILGGALGYGVSGAMSNSTIPDLSHIVIAVGFSMAIGIFFGYYPANKAAKLDPIDALRYE